MPSSKKIRYAVIGQGYISQVAVLPAFANARENSELVAILSEDPQKLAELGRKYRVKHTYPYEKYDECLRSGEVDAVYIALPNHLHRDYAVRAAEAGVHILCEKPMAVTEQECGDMIESATRHSVKLMIAYRLHFEEANLKAIDIVQSGTLGTPRLFDSVFTQQVQEGNIRLKRETGGGTLYDIGIYCINAARYLFREEPQEVFAMTANNGEPRFAEVDEMTSAVLRFPGERLASFTCSFGAADVSMYRIVGTHGDLRVEPAYEFADRLKHYLTVDGKTKTSLFGKRDQFAPQLLYFSNCILENQEPEPSGLEGLADVRIIRALYRSAQTRQPESLAEFVSKTRPTVAQQIRRPSVRKPPLVRASSPSGE